MTAALPDQHFFRGESGRLVATLTRMLGVHQLALAEDAVQETLAAAVEVWAFRGVPDNPSASLMTAARNRTRLTAVHRALYLLFNEGYHGACPDGAVRLDLCREAMRLVALLVEHAPSAIPATHALAALMALDAARLPARVNAAGDLTELSQQDRSRWTPP